MACPGRYRTLVTIVFAIAKDAAGLRASSVPVPSFQSGWTTSLSGRLSTGGTSSPNSKPGGEFITRKGTAKDGNSVLARARFDVRLHGIDAPERDQECQVSCPPEAPNVTA